MINMLRIMTNASHALLQTWGTVQLYAKLYNLTHDNISPVNLTHTEISYRITQELSHHN